MSKRPLSVPKSLLLAVFACLVALLSVLGNLHGRASGSTEMLHAKVAGLPVLSLSYGLIVAAILIPTGYLFIVARSKRYTRQRLDSEVALERMVEARTLEISNVNRELNRQNASFHAAMENMPHGLCIYDDAQRVVYCNSAYAGMYGLPEEQISAGASLRQIIESRIANGSYVGGDADTFRRSREGLQILEAREKVMEVLCDGRTIAITRCPLPDRGWLSIHEDVTDHVQVQEAIRRDREKLSQILRNVPIAVITSDASGLITGFNPVAEQTFGYTADEVIGRNVSMLMPEKHAAKHDGYLRSYLDTGVSKFIDVGPRRLVAHRRDGTEFPIELALAQFGSGKDLGFIGVTQDITKAQKAETQLIEHRDLLQREVDKATAELRAKAELLSGALAKEKELSEQQRQFVAMASHEFRTPLAIIDGSAQRLRRRARNNRLRPEDVTKRMDIVRTAVQRMTELMESVLSLARLQDGKIDANIGTCDIARTLREVCEQQQDISDTHEIACNIIDLPEAILADRVLLDQVFSNLLSNAVKYAPDARRVDVTAKREGDEIAVSVRDYGVGIDPEDVPYIGDKFFRAKTSTGIAGTGIGLNLVRKFVQVHQGRLEIQSIKGSGSTFTVRLPVAGPTQKAAAGSEAP